ncbi:DUF1707 SHOCT-like domain-containing protein [Actinoplanes sichuanensis]|uniref:DUF1707 domain-containing protein n=1 Tax=Actinoplanes sichuanensis TaxID=512349 RepID=A0ABW4A4U0_9ACTN|nr:DUF1707 domain-containing protein [Actinoplanes sichuanensis]
MSEVKRSNLRIGAPERALARTALEQHLTDGRIDGGEFEQRLLACETARTRSEIRAVFADLPDPRPDLKTPADETYDEVGITSGCMVIILGVPAAILMGVVYGAWWSVVVAVAIALLIGFAAELVAEWLRRLR